MKAAVADLSQLKPILEEVVKEVVTSPTGNGLDPMEVKETVEKAVKEVVLERVQEILGDTKE
jgi:hypothetical protein